MPLIPAKLPIWAYAVAGGAAFVAARVASSSPDQGAPAAAAAAADPASSDLWQSFGGGTADGYGQFGGGDGGVLPPADPGQTGAGTPPPTTPPPTTPPPAAPATNPWPSSLGAKPSGAGGYLVSNGGAWFAYTGLRSALPGGTFATRTSYSGRQFTAWSSKPLGAYYKGGKVAVVKVMTGAYAGWYIGTGNGAVYHAV